MSEGENEAFKNLWHGREEGGQSIAIAGTGLLRNGGRWKKSYAKFHTRAHEKFIKHTGTPGFS